MEQNSELSQAILQAVNEKIGNHEVLEVIYVIASDDLDEGESKLTFGSCLTTNKKAREHMLKRALGKVK